MKIVNLQLSPTTLLLVFCTQSLFAGGIPLTTDDLGLTTAINSSNVLLDILSNDDSGIVNDNFKEVIAVCSLGSTDMDCTGNSYTDGIGTVTVNGTGNANNVFFESNHDQTHTFEFKYMMHNSNNNPGSGNASVALSYFQVNSINDSVNNNCDATDCSLREAINAAANDDEPTTITFKRDMQGTIVLTSGLVINSNDLSIVGPGAANIDISGDDMYRVLSVPIGIERFSMSGLTISHGQTPNQQSGAGIFIENALETRLENIKVTQNNADSNGGGIYALNATLTLINSEVSHNSAGFNGGGIAIVGGFGSDVTIQNSTISNNQSNNTGDGLFIDASSGQNTMLKFITSAFNFGSSVDNRIEGSGNIIIESSIFEPGLSIASNNNITNNSIFKNISNGNIFGNNNLSETDFILNPALVEINNSGLFGHTFDATNIAYNHVDDMIGDASCGNQITTDQFGNSRPTDGRCDAGAYEYIFVDLIFNSDFE